MNQRRGRVQAGLFLFFSLSVLADTHLIAIFKADAQQESKWNTCNAPESFVSESGSILNFSSRINTQTLSWTKSDLFIVEFAEHSKTTFVQVKCQHTVLQVACFSKVWAQEVSLTPLGEPARCNLTKASLFPLHPSSDRQWAVFMCKMIAWYSVWGDGQMGHPSTPWHYT